MSSRNSRKFVIGSDLVPLTIVPHTFPIVFPFESLRKRIEEKLDRYNRNLVQISKILLFHSIVANVGFVLTVGTCGRFELFPFVT